MTDSTKKPEYREDDSWFSKEQLSELAPADHADLVHSPIPTQMVSNGEYMPIVQTDKQKEVELRLAALSARAAKQLGMSRRKFLKTTGGFAASFIAMNQVFGEFFDVRPIDMLVPEAYAQGGPPVLAVAEIHYVDTSGEAIDQSADHRRRLREFEAALRSDLAASGKIANAALECPPNACSVGDITDGQLMGKAKEAGATHLLIGRFHKMSTLIQQAKFDVIDVKARKVVFDRYISFRGDNDAAWRRAESFLARQILDHGEW